MTTNDTRTKLSKQRQAESDAAELYPLTAENSPTDNACAYAARHGYITAKTENRADVVSRESDQYRQIVDTMHLMIRRSATREGEAYTYQNYADNIVRALGFKVEGEDDV